MCDSYSLSNILGLDKDIPYNSTQQVIGQQFSLISPYISNTAGYGTIYVTCDNISSQNSKKASNIICAIHNQGSTSFTYNHETFDMIYNMKEISQRSQIWFFTLVDEYKNIIDLGGIPLSFTIHLFKYNTNVFLPIKQK
jgi:hypothetical protein